MSSKYNLTKIQNGEDYANAMLQLAEDQANGELAIKQGQAITNTLKEVRGVKSMILAIRAAAGLPVDHNEPIANWSKPSKAKKTSEAKKEVMGVTVS